MILVTGGAGFIGFHLNSLLCQENEVSSIDSFSDYYSVDLKQMRSNELENTSRITVKNIDMCDVEALERVLDANPIKTVVHLAAQPGVRLRPEHYSKYVSSNVVAFENLMQACVKKNVKNIIFASSSSVYGNYAKVPLSETETNLLPESYYGATKLSNEITAKVMASRHGLRIFALRFFTVYGPWGRPDMAYTRIASALINDEDFRMFGDGTVVRDFTYVDDVVSTIQLLCKSIGNRDEGSFEVLNIGGGKPSSLREMIQEFERQAGRELKVAQYASNPSDMKITHADWTKLESFCGKIPRTPLSEGIERTFAWANDAKIRTKLRTWTTSVA